MYKIALFSTENIVDIEKDIIELKATYGVIKRIFLLNGDAFVLSAQRLKQISDKLIEYFPKLQTITTFASVRNIMSKTNDELNMLRKAKFNELYIGIETGNRNTIDYFNKGYTLDDMYKHLPRLTKAGIKFYAAMMLGTGGKGMGIQTAIDTAKLLNKVKPIAAGYTTMGLFPGTQIAKDAKKGNFVSASEREVIEELIKVIELVDVKGMVIENEHNLNMIMTKGILPRDRKKMLASLRYSLDETHDDILDSSIARKSL